MYSDKTWVVGYIKDGVCDSEFSSILMHSVRCTCDGEFYQGFIKPLRAASEVNFCNCTAIVRSIINRLTIV